MFEFYTCISREKLPVYLGLPVVPVMKSPAGYPPACWREESGFAASEASLLST